MVLIIVPITNQKHSRCMQTLAELALNCEVATVKGNDWCLRQLWPSRGSHKWEMKWNWRTIMWRRTSQIGMKWSVSEEITALYSVEFTNASYFIIRSFTESTWDGSKTQFLQTAPRVKVFLNIRSYKEARNHSTSQEKKLSKRLSLGWSLACSRKRQ